MRHILLAFEKEWRAFDEIIGNCRLYPQETASCYINLKRKMV